MKTKLENKEKLKKEILSNSIKYFKKYGKDGAPVDKLMAEVGATSGALYSHFLGKDDLFIQSIEEDMKRLIDKWTGVVTDNPNKGLKKIVNFYLSEKHVRSPEIGCLMVALSSDLYRLDCKKRVSIELGIEKLIEAVASGLLQGSKKERKEQARFILSTMVGAISICRIIYPGKPVKEFLRSAKKSISAILK
ncbi:MAG: TetR/AcrR family transcriptional regulator [Bdellovibrionales bacterium]|nr:TetR/AcrR family transcriptional regulator [Bdellovibrionales bacterium]